MFLNSLKSITAAISTLFLLFIAWITWKIVVYPKFLSPLRCLPGPKSGSFIHGQLWTFLSAPQPPWYVMRNWINTIPNDGLIRFTSVCNQERLLLTSTEALAEAMVTRNYDWEKSKQMRDGLSRILGTGVLLAMGDDHKNQRKSLIPAFSPRYINNLYPVFWVKATEMVKLISKQIDESSSSAEKPGTGSAVVDLGGWLRRATLDIIGIAGIGQDFHALTDPKNELNKVYSQLFDTAGSERTMALIENLENLIPVSFLARLPLKTNRAISSAASALRRISRELVRSKKRHDYGNTNSNARDILSIAIETGDFTEDNLVDQAMTFLAAGHETTATSVFWTIFMLCKHPEVQSRLRHEIRAGLPSVDDVENPITAAMVDRLVYLNAVCNEVLRLYPPVPLTRRDCVRDTVLLGHHVPKGTTIFLVPAAINTSKKLWGDDADEFKPERWLSSDASPPSKYANLTFMHGPRSCIGQKFGRSEFACLLAAVVGRFSVKFAEGEPKLRFCPGITLRLDKVVHFEMTTVPGW